MPRNYVIAYAICFQRRDPPTQKGGRWHYSYDSWPLLFKTVAEALSFIEPLDVFKNTRTFPGGKSRYKSCGVKPVKVSREVAERKWKTPEDPSHAPS